MKLVEETPHRFRLDPHGAMRVPGVVFATRDLLADAEQSLTQVANVATLPGIVTASYAMPDIHWGYGFPIGGVAATAVDEGGVISPGGVGFDISCGVRLLAADCDRATLAPALGAIMDGLDHAIPRGAGPGGVWHPRPGELDRILEGGARYAVAQGYGEERDLVRCEDGGAVDDAEVREVGARARERGLGHQICTDHVRAMDRAMARYHITVPDRQLACTPVDSPEGRAYLGAMAAAANYGRANRQLLSHAARRIFRRAAGVHLSLVYDVSHNLAKLETHPVDGRPRRLCVHRKGATRAFPPGHPDLPADLREAGQPVLIPGTMGTASYVLAGVTGGDAFASTCHGAGRRMSRHEAARTVTGRELRARLEHAGIAVRPRSWRGLSEETPEAYKDVTAVVAASEGAGLCRTVARLVPLGVVKG
jgi:tRNA-splicing ligase RtcB